MHYLYRQKQVLKTNNKLLKKIVLNYDLKIL